MNLKLAKLLAFVLITADYQGVMTKSPQAVLRAWELVDSAYDLAALIEHIGPWPAASINNYMLIWAKELDGLAEAVELVLPVEAKNVPIEQSEKSESVIKED